MSLVRLGATLTRISSTTYTPILETDQRGKYQIRGIIVHNPSTSAEITFTVAHTVIVDPSTEVTNRLFRVVLSLQDTWTMGMLGGLILVEADAIEPALVDRLEMNVTAEPAEALEVTVYWGLDR